MTGLRIDSYQWTGGREAMLRFGPEDGPVVIGALPLFEEANRTRAFIVSVLRTLAQRGIGSVLPDLPGTGDSPVDTRQARLSDMRAAYASLAQGIARPFSVAIRSGALLDTTADLAGRWHLAPHDGPALVRELGRIAPLPTELLGAVEVAGNLLAPELLAELSAALPASSARIARLAGDPRSADILLDGTPLWRRTEPGSDPALARLVADDIAGWIMSCAG